MRLSVSRYLYFVVIKKQIFDSKFLNDNCWSKSLCYFTRVWLKVIYFAHLNFSLFSQAILFQEGIFRYYTYIFLFLRYVYIIRRYILIKIT